MMDFSGMKELSIGGVKLRELSVGGVKVWRSGRLPSGYTEVEYIETDGSSWIDTGVNPSAYPSGLEYFFKGQYYKHNTDATNNYLWGCLNSSKRSGNVTINRNLNNLVLYIGAQSNTYKAIERPAYNTDFEVYLKATSTNIATSIMTLDGVEAPRVNASSDCAMPDDNIYLCYCPNVGDTSKPMIGRVYSFTVNDADGTPIRRYVPCVNPGGTVGMYDLVSGTFFTNAGTGVFTAGAAVA